VKPSIIIKVLFGFLSGFLFGTGIKYVYETTAFQPYEWKDNMPPIIVNCYGDDFSELQMQRAVTYWEEKGHDIGFYEHNPPPMLCEDTYLEGFIILRKGGRFDHESGVLAETRRWTSLTEIKGAVITYRPGSQNLQWINEHELGHALGYAHYEKEGHIMHPLFHKMDGKFWIP
tara:strand:- start:454 stop:972 length:519 start_codon:yes stop_codon:yes gene_type:complete